MLPEQPHSRFGDNTGKIVAHAESLSAGRVEALLSDSQVEPPDSLDGKIAEMTQNNRK